MDMSASVLMWLTDVLLMIILDNNGTILVRRHIHCFVSMGFFEEEICNVFSEWTISCLMMSVCLFIKVTMCKITHLDADTNSVLLIWSGDNLMLRITFFVNKVHFVESDSESRFSYYILHFLTILIRIWIA